MPDGIPTSKDELRGLIRQNIRMNKGDDKADDPAVPAGVEEEFKRAEDTIIDGSVEHEP